MMTESPLWTKNFSVGMFRFKDPDLGTGMHECHIFKPAYARTVGLPEHFILVKDGVLAVSSNYPPAFRELSISMELAYLHGGLTRNSLGSSRVSVLKQALKIAKQKTGIDYLDIISFWECYFRENAAVVESMNAAQHEELEDCRKLLSFLHADLTKRMREVCTT